MIRLASCWFLSLPTALAMIASSALADGPSVVLRRQGETVVVAVEGFNQIALDQLAKLEPNERRWATILAVRVADQHADAPAMLGSHRIEADALWFQPRFAFVPGLRYRAEFRFEEPSPVVLEFLIPKPEPGAPTVVREVFPSRSTLPENLLKFYLHFSAPMRRGGAHEFIRLLTENGDEVDQAFLNLDEELWDRDGRRLTILIDPGRIKHDVGPREGLGPVLEPGKTYILHIDHRWPDSEGRPLERSHRKVFQTTDADLSSPDVLTWRVQPPATGSTDPLIIESPESLDQALFGRLLRVERDDGADVPGRATVAEEETRWMFTPDRPWGDGGYRLVVDALLEDLAGNNLQRPFELDVFDQVDRRDVTRVFHLPFETRNKP